MDLDLNFQDTTFIRSRFEHDYDTAKQYENYLLNVLKEDNLIDTKQDLLELQSRFSDFDVQLAFSDEDHLETLKQMDDKTDELLKEHLQNSASSLFISGRNEVVVSPSAKLPGDYQITFFDEYGALSDNQRKTIEEVVRELKMNHCIPLRTGFSEFVVELDKKNQLIIKKDMLGDIKMTEYVFQLDAEQKDKIEVALREAIKDTGLYTDTEVEEHVQLGLDSKIIDLEDTIPVFDILNNTEELKQNKSIKKKNGKESLLDKMKRIEDNLSEDRPELDKNSLDIER